MKQHRSWRTPSDSLGRLRRATGVTRTVHFIALVLVSVTLAAAGTAVAVAGERAPARHAVDRRTLGAAGITARDALAQRLPRPVPLVARSATGPTPPADVIFEGRPMKTASAPGGPGEVIVVGVPPYKWRDGCGPTSVGMVVGYWDGHGYDELVPGGAVADSPATQQMIASHGTADAPGHYDDYSLPMETTSTTVLPDRSELPVGDEHVADSVADFMRTSWSAQSAVYGMSWSSMIGSGFTEYVRSRYPDSLSASTTIGGAGDASWAHVRTELDAGRPLVFLVDSTGDGRTDHFVTVFGYRETNGYPEYACWDTWSTTLMRWERFRPMSTDYAWGVWGGFTFTIGASVPEPTPTPTPTPTPMPTPTETPTPPVDMTAPVTTVSGADDAWHASSVTLTFAARDEGSGVAATEYSLDGGAWMEGTALTLALGKRGVNSGVHAVTYRSVDLAGNVEAEHYAYVKLDGKPPVTASNAAAYSGSGAFTLVLSAADALSGVATTWYALDGKAYKTGASVQITGKGTHTVKFYSVDVAGNAEGAKSVRIVIK